jgi:RNA polymerase sigma factor (sigma-70 family)
MHSIAYHTYVDWRRANSRSEARPEEWWAERVCPQRTPDQAAASNDLAVRIYRLVDELPSELRDTVHLHYYQELTLQETADALGLAVSTIKYRLRQALAKLEANLAGEQFQTAPRLNIQTI